MVRLVPVAGGGDIVKRHDSTLIRLGLLFGILFTLAWESGWLAPTEIQYATTPTSTWKTITTVPAGISSFTSAAENNALTRGRFYYFRARHILDNGAKTAWSKKVGAVWLTGVVPEDNTFLVQKGDNAVISMGRVTK